VPDHGKVRVTLLTTGVVVDYESQQERDQSLLLAQARQRIAERTGYIPGWDELGEEDQEKAALEARNWLRAAAECGLITEAGDA
jgi:protein subunit release factor B